MNPARKPMRHNIIAKGHANDDEVSPCARRLLLISHVSQLYINTQSSSRPLPGHYAND